MSSLVAPIRKLKDAGVNIFTIGIGPKVRRDELDFMASGRTHVFYVANMQQLPTLLSRISSSSCQGLNDFLRLYNINGGPIWPEYQSLSSLVTLLLCMMLL